MSDDLDELIAEQLRDPRIRAAYDDSVNRSRVCHDLVAARHAAGLTPEQLAARIAECMCMRPRRARRWVEQYESGQLASDAPFWLLHVYARAVGVAVRVTVQPATGESPIIEDGEFDAMV